MVLLAYYNLYYNIICSCGICLILGRFIFSTLFGVMDGMLQAYCIVVVTPNKKTVILFVYSLAHDLVD